MRASLAAALFCVVAIGCTGAAAQPFPSRPLRIVVPLSAGAADTLSRSIAAKLTERWNQAVVVEKLFAWPGVGSLLIDSVFQRDIPTVQGCILMIVLFFLLINTLVDLAYVVIDPRIRYG